MFLVYAPYAYKHPLFGVIQIRTLIFGSVGIRIHRRLQAATSLGKEIIY